MGTHVLVVFVFTWLAILALAFLLLGTLRSQAILSWRLDQLALTTPSKINRNGLKPGTPARIRSSGYGGQHSLAPGFRRQQGFSCLHPVGLRTLPYDHARARGTAEDGTTPSRRRQQRRACVDR